MRFTWGSGVANRETRRRVGRRGRWTAATIGALVAACLLGAPLVEARAEEKSNAAIKAERLMALVGVKAIIEQTIDPTLAQITDLIVKMNPNDGMIVKQLIDQYVAPEFRQRVPEYVELSAGLYAQHFTEAEIDELIRFYETPLGQKLIERLPTLTQQSLQMGELWGRKVALEALIKLVPKLEEHGLQAPKI